MKDRKAALFIVTDVLFINFALVLSVAAWYAGLLTTPMTETVSIPLASWYWLLWMSLAGSALNVIVLAGFRLYGQLWRYAGSSELLKIFTATIITMILLYLLDMLAIRHVAVLPRRVFVMAWFMLFLLSVASRLGERITRRIVVTIGFMLSSKSGMKRVMVVGAGYAGVELVRVMIHSRRRERMPVLLIDDDPTKKNAHFMGIKIMGDIDNIPYLAKAHAIDEITIAMPNADNTEIRRILEYCTQTDCRLTIVPPISEVSGVETKARDVSISDLLFRDEVKLDKSDISAYIEGATVLVTGGGGSIGSELCRQLLRFKPSRIVILEIYENNAFELMNELQEKQDIPIILRIGSIRDKVRMDEIFLEFKPDVVFHAAAHKHVSIVENSPAEGVKNNIFGTQNVIRAAVAHECRRFVLISTDKAVRPPNIYGATKRVAEIVMQREAVRNSSSKTLLTAVRFGNVLGASGTIIPKFKRQIAQGGPVTVYDKKVERFFMTISEACQLVLQAGGLADETNKGHIFILDMGKPVNIDDLARKLIRLSGFRPDDEIKIEYKKLTPGEKMTEELILPEEKDSLQTTSHGKIWMAKPAERNYAIFDSQLDRLKTFSQGETGRIVWALREMDLHYDTDDKT